MKHTKGNWKVNSELGVDIMGRSEDGFDSILIASVAVPTIGTDHPSHQLGMLKNEQLANGKLIAEAGTVTNETGFAPRQLADQKAKLLEALKEAVELIKTAKRLGLITDHAKDNLWKYYLMTPEMKRINKAIKNAS